MRKTWALGAGLGLVGMVAACGAATSSGESTSGGADVPTCEAPLTFELRVESGSYCAGGQKACDAEWLTILGPDGQPFARDNTCNTSCGDCAPVRCPGSCIQPVPIADKVTRAWDGRLFAQSTCNGSAGTLSCGAAKCAPKGRYTARMCASPSATVGDAGADAASGPSTQCTIAQGAQPKCVDVQFDWPSTTPVVGTLR